MVMRRIRIEYTDLFRERPLWCCFSLSEPLRLEELLDWLRGENLASDSGSYARWGILLTATDLLYDGDRIDRLIERTCSPKALRIRKTREHPLKFHHKIPRSS